MVRVNPHFSHVKPNCTYDNNDQQWDVDDNLSPENLRLLEARVEELEGLLNLKDTSRTTRSPSSSGSPPEFQPSLGFSPLSDEYEYSSPSFPASFDLPLVTDEWPTSLPPKQLVLHLLDLFFTCWSNSRRVIHRPTFMMSLLESPSSLRFPHIGLLHAMCAAGAIYSPFVTVTPLPTETNRHVDEVFLLRTRAQVTGRTLAFDEEQFLKSKKRCIDPADTRDYPLETLQACIINTWWALSSGRWHDVWAMSTFSTRLCAGFGFNFHDSMRHPIPDDIRCHFWIGPPQSHVEAELRRNLFWLTYAAHRLLLSVLPFAYDINDEDIHQTLPGTLEAFEAGVDDEQERQSALSDDLFTTHRDNLDDFGLYIKGSIMLSR
ncbi:hypothetical protein FRC09_012384, partial [Ceratobasidium sp. 395]